MRFLYPISILCFVAFFLGMARPALAQETPSVFEVAQTFEQRLNDSEAQTNKATLYREAGIAFLRASYETTDSAQKQMFEMRADSCFQLGAKFKDLFCEAWLCEQKGKEAKACKLYEKLIPVLSGNDAVEARYRFAKLCQNQPKLNEEETNKVWEFYRLAAEAGHPLAKLELGRLYFGLEEEDTDLKAYECFVFAVEHHIPFAYYCLGACYHYGVGVTVNFEEALKYYRQARELGVEQVTEEFLKSVEDEKNKQSLNGLFNNGNIRIK